jgi:lysozyme
VGHSSSAVTVCASGSIVQGVDVSDYQGSITWSDVKSAGIDFAIARISDGSDLDTEFAANWSGMQSVGLVRGAYQYFEPGEDPTTQANIVISAVGKLGDGDLPVTADMETTGGESASTIVANLQTWMTAVQAGTGKVPMIYTAEGYWDSDVDSSAFSSNPLWAANWGVTCPDLAAGWSSWEVWQYSDSGSVSGICGAVDLDEFNGTLAQLQAFAGGSSSSSPDSGTPSGVYGAEYVSQSWALASTTMMMTTCQTIAASITLKNIGTLPWDSHTRLATTQPRNRVSDFADSTWIANDRPAAVTGTVAPGDTFEFKFDFHAPPTAGAYLEYFGVVEDGVAWFSDPGQDGPPDNDIEANIEVTASGATCTVDPGVPDASVLTPDGGGTPPTADGGTTTRDGAVRSDGGGFTIDAGSRGGADSSTGPGLDATPQANNGCACEAAGGQRGGGRAALVLGGALFVIAAGRKRRTLHTGYERRAPIRSPAGICSRAWCVVTKLGKEPRKRCRARFPAALLQRVRVPSR